MKRLSGGILLLIAVGVALILLGEYGFGPIVVTREGEQKLILLLREAREEPTAPGLFWRVPIIGEAETFESRQLYLNVEPLPIQTRDEERIVVDNYVVWRIDQLLNFRKSFPVGMADAEHQIDRVVRADVRQVIGQHTLEEVVTSARTEIMDKITQESRSELSRYGIRVIDVRINLTELPRATEQNVYARMRAERQRLARKNRAEGDEQARRIRAEAEREARVIVANAKREAEILRGEGDALAARIYSDAYTQDPKFYAFVRNLEAYRKTIGEGTTLVLPPSHEFFRLFESSGSDDAATSQAPSALESPDSQTAAPR